MPTLKRLPIRGSVTDPDAIGRSLAGDLNFDLSKGQVAVWTFPENPLGLLNLQVDLFAPSELSFLAGLAPWLDAHHVLDVGCGNGAFTARLRRQFPEKKYLGIDVSPELIAHALSAPVAGVAFSVADFFTFQPEQNFDLILMRFIVQHLTNFDAILKQTEKLLSARGVLLIVEPSLEKSRNVPATPAFEALIANFEQARSDGGRIRQRLQKPEELLSGHASWRIAHDEIVYARHTDPKEIARIHRLYRKWTEMFERSGLLTCAFADVYRELEEWAIAGNSRSEIARRAICAAPRGSGADIAPIAA